MCFRSKSEKLGFSAEGLGCIASGVGPASVGFKVWGLEFTGFVTSCSGPCASVQSFARNLAMRQAAVGTRAKRAPFD